MKVLFDTNFLMYCVQKKVQLFDFLEKNFDTVLVFQGVIDELTRISQDGKIRERTAAEVSLKLIDLHSVKILPLQGYVDQNIRKYISQHHGIVVATLDRGLRRTIQGRSRLLLLKGRKLMIE